jgi:hypothetical protein
MANLSWDAAELAYRPFVDAREDLVGRKARRSERDRQESYALCVRHPPTPRSCLRTSARARSAGERRSTGCGHTRGVPGEVLISRLPRAVSDRRRVFLMAVLCLAVSACDGASHGNGASPLRDPSEQERREIVAVTRWDYAYESDRVPYRPSRIGVRLRLPPRLEPKIVRIRVSRSDPRFALTVVELRDARGRRRPGTTVRLLERTRGPRPAKRLSTWNPPWEVVEESGIGFRRACTRATPRSIRALVCPDPWSLADYPRPRIPLNASVQMPRACANHPG